MIRINLLPPEHRRPERTPLRVLLPLVLAVTVFVSGGAVTAWVHFGWRARVADELGALESELTGHGPRLAYLRALTEEEAEYEQRSETIQSIAASRISWTRKLDELCDVIWNEGDTGRYLIWLSTLEAKPAQAVGRKKLESWGSVALKGLCLSDEDSLKAFNAFHAALDRSAYFRDFLEMNKPAGKEQVLNEEDLLPRKAWTFDLQMALRLPEPAPKARPSVARPR